MQMHAPRQAAPAMGAVAIGDPIWIMQNHAQECALLQREKSHRNGGSGQGSY